MDIFTVQELQKRLQTRVLGRSPVLLDAVDSTNKEARRMLAAGCQEGTVIIAQEQSGGKGRRGRRWVSARGCGLWMTAVIKPVMPEDELQKLTLLAGLAVCRAVGQSDGEIRPVIKWPNDVLLRGGKLCGILCESAVDADGVRRIIAGIGVNIRRPDTGWGIVEGVAAALEECTEAPAGRLELAASILNEMESLLDDWQARGFAGVAAGYRETMLPAGTAVEIVDGDRRRQGVIEGLDDGGALLVRLESGNTERIISGEISVRSVQGYA